MPLGDRIHSFESATSIVTRSRGLVTKDKKRDEILALLWWWKGSLKFPTDRQFRPRVDSKREREPALAEWTFESQWRGGAVVSIRRASPHGEARGTTPLGPSIGQWRAYQVCTVRYLVGPSQGSRLSRRRALVSQGTQEAAVMERSLEGASSRAFALAGRVVT